MPNIQQGFVFVPKNIVHSTLRFRRNFQFLLGFPLRWQTSQCSIHTLQRFFPPENSIRYQRQSSTPALWRQQKERAFCPGRIAGACSVIFR